MATSAANPTRTPSGLLTFLGGIVLLAIFAAIVVFWISFKAPKEDIEAKRAAGRIETREKLAKEAQEKLNSDGWVDKAKGIARISIADALKLTVDDLKKKKVAPSTLKVEAPLPMPTVEPNSTEPPPLRMPSAPQGADTFPFQVPGVARKTEAPGAPAAPATVPALTPATPAPATPAPAAPAQPAPAPQAAPAPEAPAQPAPAPQATPATPAPATPAPAAPAPPAPAPQATPAPAAPAQPAPAPQAAPATPAPATPAPAVPAPPAPAPQATPATPAPATPAPAPAAPASQPASPAAEATAPTAALSVPANRPPLINWTETK